MVISQKWTSDQDEYIKNNYSTKKAIDLANDLGRTTISVKNRIQKLKLKLDEESKKQKYKLRKQKYNINSFFFESPNPNDEFVSAYLLGYLWADGCVSKKNKRKENKISLCVTTKDLMDVVCLFKQSGDWKIRNCNTKKGQPLSMLYGYSWKLHDYLTENDFQNKSLCSPSKILNNKSSQYIRGFWRGYLDGDGCYHMNPKKRKKMITLTGARDQDWSCYELLLDQLDIKHNKNVKKNGSSIVISTADGILKFIDFIYPQKVYDSIGLKRKFEKAMELKSFTESLMIKNARYYQ